MRNKVLLLLFPVVLFFACSRSEPKITYGTIRLVYFQAADKPEERFSFFVLPDDDDGIEDIADLYLYHDREGLFWHIPAEEWVTFEAEGKTWIGTRSLAMSDDESLPRGQFRAVLIDKGGEKSQRLFTFDAPEDPRYPFPFFSITEGRYLVESGYPEHTLICYDGEGNFVTTQPLQILDGTVASLSLPAGIRGIALWAEDSEYLSSALTDVIAIR
ncbi:hypothetical protein AGMMS50267_02710 [Spirochaetia bacterium]|nr:hypothetical protein AGMMS50267_02710 [Spirochaetia bacterium]